MRIKVTYVINGSTQIDFWEAPHFLTNILPSKIGRVVLRDENENKIKAIMYGECAKIEDLDSSDLSEPETHPTT